MTFASAPRSLAAASTLLVAALLMPLGLGACGDDGSSASSGSDTGADLASDAGSDGDDADVGADATSDAPVLALSCEPEAGRCDGFGDDRPRRLSEHAAAYDPEGRQMIVYGGSSAVPQQCDFPSPVYEEGTWLYDEPCNAWVRVDTTSNPGPRVRHMMAFGDGKAWLFGGRYRAGTSGNYTLYDDVWAFDMATLMWSELQVSGERPSGRVNGAFVWDSRRGHLWLFGGNESASGLAYTPLRDVWELDPVSATWTRHAISGTQPAERLFHVGFYDSARDALVAYGGADENAFGFSGPVVYMGDLWFLELETLVWTRLHAGDGDAPDGRFWAGGAYDPIGDRYLVFAGHDDASLGNRNDVWAFDPSAGSWSLGAEQDTLQGQPNGFCDFPPDFAAVAAGTPERRDAHTMVWSPCGHALVYGGKSDCGATDDVWAFGEDGWQELQEATVGEACVRWRNNPDNCANLCF